MGFNTITLPSFFELGQLQTFMQCTPTSISIAQIEDDRCPVCKIQRNELLELQKIFSIRLFVINVEIPTHRDLVANLDLEIIPTLFFMKYGDLEIIQGYMAEKNFVKLFNKCGRTETYCINCQFSHYLDLEWIYCKRRRYKMKNKDACRFFNVKQCLKTVQMPENITATTIFL